jgi:hypothetical protein
MAKAAKSDTWKPTPHKDPIDGKPTDAVGGSRDISGKIEKAQRADTMRGR